MKKTNLLFAAFAAGMILLGLNACEAGKESTRIMNKNFDVSPFHAIESEIVGNVVFKQSDRQSVSVRGSENLVKNLIVEVDNGKLKLSAQKTAKKRNASHKLTVSVSAPGIEKIDLGGVGNLKLSGSVKSDSLSIALSGVGNFDAEDLEVQSLFVESEGVGNIHLKGRANSVKIKSDNVGNIDASAFIARAVRVNLSGVGNVTCYASDILHITASGVGNITYLGNPAAKTIDRSGVGKVKNGQE
ncbi:MAG: DUF2807 domain-containing protein [Dysgonamonadaceae bacterium]|jgi:hypothetical protein|nr:DUF2807 domain-containing protein [Dysgonamonadaceae bacterium]